MQAVGVRYRDRAKPSKLEWTADRKHVGTYFTDHRKYLILITYQNATTSPVSCFISFESVPWPESKPHPVFSSTCSTVFRCWH